MVNPESTLSLFFICKHAFGSDVSAKSYKHTQSHPSMWRFKRAMSWLRCGSQTRQRSCRCHEDSSPGQTHHPRAKLDGLSGGVNDRLLPICNASRSRQRRNLQALAVTSVATGAACPPGPRANDPSHCLTQSRSIGPKLSWELHVEDAGVVENPEEQGWTGPCPSCPCRDSCPS